MCGKNHLKRQRYISRVGSPPRVREKPSFLRHKACNFRITPACAGKTRLNISLVSSTWDHPRVCGKNHLKRQRYISRVGSPPRVREKPSFLRHKACNFRITPACAGKTRLNISLVSSTWDHPRVCGKNHLKRQRYISRVGSPPRVREKLIIVCQPSIWVRITPACAGKTRSKSSSGKVKWDHPRVCGKNRIRFGLAQVKVGSPPRVREKLC